MTAQRSRWLWVLRLLGLALLAREVHWLASSPFNEDELENLQVLWLLHHGVLFGRDYVTSHLPAYPLLLYPLYRAMGPVAELAGAARWMIAPFVALTLLQIHVLGRRVAGSETGGWLALAGTLASPTIAASLVLSRPDAAALPMALGGLLLFDRYARRARGRTGLLLAGLSFGCSTLFNPKAVFLILATAWAAERHHRADLGLPARERWIRLAVLLGCAGAPFAASAAALALAGVVSARDVGVFLTTGYAWLDAERFGPYKVFLLQQVVGLAPWPWLVGLVTVARAWRPAAGAADRTWDAVRATALAETVHVLGSAVLVVQLLLLPTIMLAAATARALRRVSPSIVVPLAVIAVALSSLAPLEDPSSRAEQLERMRFVLAHVPEDRPVIDGRFGLEAFRPLVGRFQQYRPWVYRPAVYAREEALVIEAIVNRRAGAVIHHPLFPFIRPEIRALVERGYAPSEHPEVWLPRAR